MVACGSYFFTVVALGRQPILCRPDVRAALRDAIQSVQSQHPFTVDAWVLMPDHLHTIWTLSPADSDYAKRWSMIKRRVTQQCGALDAATPTNSQSKRREGGIWQRRFWEHQIQDEADFERHADYIHYNPVKHGLVNEVREWPYSTYHQFVKSGVYPPDWGNEAPVFKGGFGE